MDLMNIIMTYREILSIVLFTLLIIATIAYMKRENLSLWWVHWRYNNFLFGKIRSLAKNDTSVDEGSQNDWFQSETEVCNEYLHHYREVDKDPDFYDDCKNYLSIVGEAGRKPYGLAILFGLGLILALEAWGFSYTMSGFIDLTASETTRQYMATAVAIFFAVGLHYVTHMMGHEIHRNKLIENIRDNWRADPDPQKPIELTQNETHANSRIENPDDADEKTYLRRLNRLNIGKAVKSHFWIYTTISAILIIAIVLTFVRIKALEAAQANDVMCTQPGTSSDSPNFGSLDNLYGESDVNASSGSLLEQAKLDNQEANEKAQSDVCKATEMGSWLTFGVLAILFFMLQAFATWISVKYGFEGKLSGKAYKFTNKFNTRREFENYIANQRRTIATAAQKTMNRLQSKMSKLKEGLTDNRKINALNHSNERSFNRYLEVQEEYESSSTINRLRRNVEHEHSRQNIESTSLRAAPALEPEVIITESKTTALTDDEVRAQLLAELHVENAKVETPEEQRARILRELQDQGKV